MKLNSPLTIGLLVAGVVVLGSGLYLMTGNKETQELTLDEKIRAKEEKERYSANFGGSSTKKHKLYKNKSKKYKSKK